MTEEWPGQAVAAEGEQWPGQVASQDDQPSALHRLATGLAPITPEREDAILRAFHEGIEDVSQEQYGFSDKSLEWLRKAGYFPSDDSSALARPFQAAAEAFMRPAVAGMDALWRLPQGLYRGVQKAAIEAGVPADIASIPDAFAGSPAHFAEPLPSVKPAPIRPIEGAPPLRRSFAAQTGIPEVDAVLNSSVTKQSIDDAVIDRSHTVPYMAGGSTPLEDPTVYVDKHVPKEQTAPSMSGGPPITFDPAEPWAVHENVEQHTMDLLIKGGMSDQEAYRVAHFEFAEKAEQAWYQAHDIDQEAAEAEQQKWLPRIQGEDATDIPPNLYDKPYPHADVRAAQQESIHETPPSPEEVARAFDIIRNAKELQPPDLGGFLKEARDLGVIGPERPSINDASPKEAAAAAIRRDDTIKSEPIDDRSPWRQRFDQFVGKLKTGDDVKALLQNAAEEGNEFPAARRGDIPLSQAEQLSEASGVPIPDLDLTGMGRLMKNDAQVRTAMRIMLKTGEDLKQAMADVAAKNGKDDLAELAALQEARMRHSVAVEQIAGLRAEWGRTGNVFQEFQEASKEASTFGKFLADNKGETIDDLRDLARRGSDMDPTDLAKFMNSARQPTTFLDKVHWYWVQGLISGLITHTGYGLTNWMYALSIHGVATPLAALIGKAKEIAGIEGERVLLGESAAALWAFHATVPESLLTAARSIKAGVRAPLASEMKLREAMIARGEKPPKVLERSIESSQIPQERPISGVLGRVLGAPGDVAGGIHSFFKINGEQASLAARAYRQTIKEGLAPGSQGFMDRVNYWRANPSESMLSGAIDDAYAGTFMGELGPKAQAFNNFVKQTPGMRWIFPFRHIPLNILKAGYEWSPIAFFDNEMRANIMGKNGGAAQDMAVAKMVAGSAVMSWFFHKYMSGEATGEYPDDPHERAAWKIAGKEPNSLLINGEWWSMQRFGPAGQIAQLGANLGRVVEGYQGGQDDALTIATTRLAEAAAHMISDAPGFQSLQNLFDAWNDPKKMTRLAALEAGTFLPFSSLEKQTASFTDPYMREAKTFLDGIKYSIPGMRQTLLPKRDWSGQPIENPGSRTIIRARTAATDPVELEMLNLNVHPAPPRDIVGGVKLTPKLYDEYQTMAGALARQALEGVVQERGWSQMPAYARAEVFRRMITVTRQTAASSLQMRYPELIQQGIDNKMSRMGQ